jgi:hypothetical protein
MELIPLPLCLRFRNEPLVKKPAFARAVLKLFEKQVCSNADRSENNLIGIPVYLQN